MKLFVVLVLLAAGIVGLAAQSPISSEARECFEWFGTLGYPELKDATFAEVWSGRWYQSGGEAPTVQTMKGFVTPMQNRRFEVVGVDLVRRELTTSDKAAKPEERVGFEPRPFVDHVRQQLDVLQHPPKDSWRRFGAKIGHQSEVFFLAYVCWHKGEPALAQSLFDEARKIPPLRDSQKEKLDSIRVSLEKELGHYAMWDAVLQCGGGRLGVDEWGHSGKPVPRTELLSNFENIVKRFPASEHIEKAKTMIAVLTRMITEDKAHKLIPDDVLAKLPIDEQVAELIFRLRDQNGHQWGQPGWCDIFDMRTEGESAAHRLVKMGYDAVPQLIDSLTDPRLSRSVGFHRDFHFSHTVLTIGDCSQQILNRITGRSFYAPRSTSSYMSRDEEVAATQKMAREWWSDFKDKGERQVLVDAIASGSEDASSLVPKLKEKYPDAVADAVLAGAAKADKTGKEWLVHRFVDLVGNIKTDAARDYLVRQLDAGKTTPIRMAAARQLWNRDHPGVVGKVIELWRSLPKAGGWSSDDGFEPVAEFLCQCGKAVAVQAMAADLDQRSAYQRFEVVESLGEAFTTKLPDHSFSEMARRQPEPDAIGATLALLAKMLEDTDARDGMSGSRGDFQFSDPRICDFALWAMHEIKPAVYAFSSKATRRKREDERITASNTWRKANGQPLLPVPSVTLPVLDENSSLRITSIAFKPADIKNEVTSMVAKLQGSALSPQTLSSVLLWFARNEVKGVRGLAIEATRDDDLRGVALDLTFTAGEYPSEKNRDWSTHYNVLMNDKSLGNSSGSSSAPYLEKDDAWKDLEDDVAQAIKSPPKTPLVIKAGLKGQ